MYKLFGSAIEDRVYQFPRILGLTSPINNLSSDTLVTAHNPETGTNWTVAGIKSDPIWLRRDWEFHKLRDGEPMSETNFKLIVPENNYELVARWLRSKLPLNDGAGEGSTWRFRPGVYMTVDPAGTLPDSNADAQGNFPEMNDLPWIRVRIRERTFTHFRAWHEAYIKASLPSVSFVDTQLQTNSKVSNRGGPDTPILVYENPPGTPLLYLISPEHVEAGGIKWERRQR